MPEFTAVTLTDEQTAALSAHLEDIGQGSVGPGWTLQSFTVELVGSVGEGRMDLSITVAIADP